MAAAQSTFTTITGGIGEGVNFMWIELLDKTLLNLDDVSRIKVEMDADAKIGVVVKAYCRDESNSRFTLAQFPVAGTDGNIPTAQAAQYLENLKRGLKGAGALLEPAGPPAPPHIRPPGRLG